MKQGSMMARSLTACVISSRFFPFLSFRFLIHKVGIIDIHLLDCVAVIVWPLTVGPLRSEAWLGWWKHHLVAESGTESFQLP